MANIIELANFRKPAEKPIPFGDVVELEKRDGRFYLQGAEVRVRLIGEHSGQTDSAKSFLESLARNESTSPLGYTRDIETGAILVPVMDEITYTTRWYQLLGEKFI